MTNQSHADVLLADGSIASISRLVPEDATELFALHDSVSDDAARMRFFTANRRTGHVYATRLLAESPTRALAFVARVHGHVVGVASAELEGDQAEIAFLVADEAHGLGIATLLLEHLAGEAREIGIRTFTAEVLAENHLMLRVFADAGFTVSKRSFGTVSVWEISTAQSESALDAADERERLSETRSLQHLLAPRNVALVGVSSGGAGIGNAVLRSIQTGGFTGGVHVVHPTVPVLGGLRTRRSLQEIPEHVDVAVITVPAPQTVDVLRDAASAGVSAAVVITSGFSELGPSGTELQRQLLQIAREHDIRLVGPNCLGLLCNDDEIRLNATFTSAVPPSGGLAIASQSGGVGIALLDTAAELDLGVRTFVSLGNQPDVSSTDLLAAWQGDLRVTAAALYLESLENPTKFARVARRFSEHKPVLAVVGGRSTGGARAGASHTAAAATSSVGIEALFAQAGVIHCRSIVELAHAARLLAEQPLPRGFRVGVVSNAGGIGILAADAADDLGLVVPELSTDLQKTLRDHVNGTIGVGNPVDLGAAALPEHAAKVLDLLLTSGEVDAVLVAVVATSVSDPAELVSAVAAARTAERGVPVLLVGMGGIDLARADTTGVTTFRSLDDALAALRHAAGYAAWLGTPHTSWTETDYDRARIARDTARGLLRTHDAAALWIDPAAQRDLMTPYGISLLGEVVQDPADAPAAAERLGFPVAVKVADPEVVHKTDLGLVRVGLTSARAVSHAVAEFGTRLTSGTASVLVQPMASGVELAVGLIRHPTFGPLVMVAAGGVAIDVLGDRTFLMPPVAPRDAVRALHSLRIWPLLNGYRGSEPVDLEALVRLVVGVGELARDVPEVTELDLNPVMASAAGAAVVDIKVRLATSEVRTSTAPRQLSLPTYHQPAT
ncbi:MAG: GNAT family N-acetyltransferase [Propionibacteriales bacterium]|nr:GNAT family N-acetyltransferase [Propionibacteriales bacterium]